MAHVEIKKSDDGTIEVAGVTPSEAFDAAIARALEGFVRETELKGFRKGKAPGDLVRRAVGEGKLLERAATLVLETEWPRVLEEHQIEAIGRPEFHIVKIAPGNPLEWKVNVATLPEVKLPDYLKLAHATRKKEHKEVSVEDKEIDEALGRLTEMNEKDGVKPEMSDAFAGTLGPFKTVEELKAHISVSLKKEKAEKERERVRIAVLEAIVSASAFALPKILIDAEEDRMLGELFSTVARMGRQWDDYLKDAGKTSDDIRAELRPDAERRAGFGLILQALARREHIVISDEDIEKRTTAMLAMYSPEELKKIDRSRVKNYVASVMENDAVFAVLEKDATK
ncbi:MAG: trigger factor [Patescibacteria group bacterium]